MLRELAYNPAPGRSGPMLAMQAMKDFRDLSIVVMELLEKRKTQDKKKRKIHKDIGESEG